MTSMADTQAINLKGMVNDKRFSITLVDQNKIRLQADIFAQPEDYHMDSETIEEFNSWDHEHKQAYLIGYMDARTEMAYLYDFDAPDYQRCYELGRTHGESDGVWVDEEDEE